MEYIEMIINLKFQINYELLINYKSRWIQGATYTEWNGIIYITATKGLHGNSYIITTTIEMLDNTSRMCCVGKVKQHVVIDVTTGRSGQNICNSTTGGPTGPERWSSPDKSGGMYITCKVIRNTKCRCTACIYSLYLTGQVG